MQALVLGLERVDLGGLLRDRLLQIVDFAGHALADHPVFLLADAGVLVFPEYPTGGETFEIGTIVPVRTLKPRRQFREPRHQSGCLSWSRSQLSWASSWSSALSWARRLVIRRTSSSRATRM